MPNGSNVYQWVNCASCGSLFSTESIPGGGTSRCPSCGTMNQVKEPSTGETFHVAQTGPKPKGGSSIGAATVITVIVAILIGAVALPLFQAPPDTGNDAPVADAGEDMEVSIGVAVQMDGSGSRDPDGRIVKYRWDFGDGETGVGINPKHTYNEVGGYTVRLIVEDTQGAEDVDTINITITPESSDYQVVTVHELFNNTMEYMDTLIMIRNATVSDPGTYTKPESADPSHYVLFDVKDDTSNEELAIYVQWDGTRPLSMSAREIVDIKGVFTWYDRNDNGSWEPWEELEIKVRSKSADSVVKVGGQQTIYYKTVNIDMLMDDPMAFYGDFVRLNQVLVVDPGRTYFGQENSPTSSLSFYVTDDSSHLPLNIYCEYDSTRPAELGWNDVVTAKGEFIFYDRNDNGKHDIGEKWEVFIARGTTDAVTTVQLAPKLELDDYQDVTVAELMADPEDYMNEYVHVSGAFVTDPGRFARGYGEDPDDYVYFYVSDASADPQEVEVYCLGNSIRPDYLSWGYEIDVYGEWTWYDRYENGLYDPWESWEIKVRHSSNDAVFMKANSTDEAPEYDNVTLAQLYADPYSYIGDYVRIDDLEVIELGNYDEDYTANPESSAYFYGNDGTNYMDLNVYAEGSAARPTRLNYSDILMIQGQFTWYDSNDNGVYDEGEDWEVKLRKASTDEISVITPAPTPVYASITLNQLLADPDNYIGELVEVTDVPISDIGTYAYSDSQNLDRYAYFFVGSGTQGRLEVFCGGGANRPTTVEYGDKVDVKGKFTWYDELENGMYDAWETWEISVRPASEDIVFVSTPAPAAFYNPINLSTLFDNAMSLVGDTFYIENLHVSDLGTMADDDAADLSGSKYFYAKDGTTWKEIQVYMEGGVDRPANLDFNDTVNAWGEFTWYDRNYDGQIDPYENWELAIRAGCDDRVEQVPVPKNTAYRTVTVDQLTANPEAFIDNLVRVDVGFVADTGSYGYGEMVNPYESGYFWITDVGGGEMVEVYMDNYADRPFELNHTDLIEVEGYFTWYDSFPNGSHDPWETWEIKVREGSSDYVRTTYQSDMADPDYTPLTMDEILNGPNGPEYWIDQPVRITDLKVTQLGSYVYDGSDDPGGTVYFYADDPSNDYELNVYCQGNATRPRYIGIDDTVNAQGIFKWYDTWENGQKDEWETWELVVRRGTNDSVMMKTKAPPASYQVYNMSSLLSAIDSNPDEYADGKLVRVENATAASYRWNSGSVAYGNPAWDHDPTGSCNFYITDATTSDDLNTYCTYDTNRPPYVWWGDTFDIQGLIMYDETYRTWEMYLRGFTDDKIEIVERATYTTVTLEDILANTSDYQGQLVRVENCPVTDYGDYQYDTLLYDVDFMVGTGGLNIKVYCEQEAISNIPDRLYTGDTVDIQCMVEYYSGTWELKVVWDANQFVRVNQSSGYTPLSLADLLGNANDYDGKLVSVNNGYVDDNGTFPTDGWNASKYVFFDLGDSTTTSKVDVYCTGGSDRPLELPNGELVEVRGLFAKYGSSWEIKVRDSTDDKVEIISARDNPPIIHTLYFGPTVPNPLDTVLVEAMVTDDVALSAVALTYTTNGWDTTTTVPMADGDMDDVFNVTLGPFAEGTEVEFRVQADDTGGNTTEYPFIPAGFTVVDQDPIITQVTRTPSQPTPYENVIIAATVSDDINVATVKLYGRVGDNGTYGNWFIYNMLDGGVAPDVTAGDGIYTCYIFPEPNKKTVQYYVQATDDSGHEGLSPAGGENSPYSYVPTDDPPTISDVIQTPPQPNPIWNVTVEARVADDIGLVSVELLYTINATDDYQVAMADDGVAPDLLPGDGMFTALIPAQFQNTQVDYQVKATDDHNYVTFSPAYAYISSSDLPPFISNLIVDPAAPLPYQVVTISAEVSDDYYLEPVLLNYSKDGQNYSREMVDDGTNGDEIPGDGIYTAQIPYGVNGTFVSYYVAAKDNASQLSIVEGNYSIGGEPPSVTMQDPPSRAAIGQKVRIAALVEDDVPETFFQKEVWLNYTYDGVVWNRVRMNDTGANGDAVAGDSIYSAWAYTGPVAGTVEYYIEAFGDSGQAGRYPETGYLYFYTPSFKILGDKTYDAYLDIDYFEGVLYDLGWNIEYKDLYNVSLGEYDAVFIWDPPEFYSQVHINELKDYVESGGALLMLCESDYNDYGQPEVINRILENFSISGRLNDDQLNDPTDNFEGTQYIIYLMEANGAFSGDTLGLTANLTKISTRSSGTVYNLSAEDIVLLHGDTDASNVDWDGINPDPYVPYVAGDEPPMLVARPDYGAGRIIYGGIAATFGDYAGSYRWDYDLEQSQLRNFTYNMMQWLLNTTGAPIDMSYIYNSPAQPTPADPVTFSVEINSTNPMGTVTLYYTPVYTAEGDTPANWTFQTIQMTDDGTGSDPIAGDGNFTATVGPFPGASIIRFYVEARDVTRQGMVKPDSAPGHAFYVIINHGDVADIKINEMLTAPKYVDWDGNGELDTYDDEWVEFYNNGTGIVDLSTIYYLEGDDTQYLKHIGDYIGGSMLMWAGSYRVIYDSDGMTLHLVNGGGNLRLYADEAMTIEIDHTAYPGLSYDGSWGRITDGWDTDSDTDWQEYETPTPGGPNNG